MVVQVSHSHDFRHILMEPLQPPFSSYSIFNMRFSTIAAVAAAAVAGLPAMGAPVAG